MANELTIIVPETGTNLLTNPSVEFDTTDYSAIGSTISRSTTVARFGTASLKAIADNAASGEGWVTTTGTGGKAATAGTTYTFTVYLYGAGTVKQVFKWYTAAGAAIQTDTSSLITLSTTWTRYTYTVTAPATTAFLAVQVSSSPQQSITFYSDGMMVQALSYATTYIDGDQPGCEWAGVAHGSTSTRSAQYRGGGREQVLETTYFVTLDANGTTGLGTAPIENIIQEYALQPGGEFQDIKIKPRVVNLRIKINGSSLTVVHTRRKAFWNVIKPDLCAPTQPFVLGYVAAQSGKTVYASFYYEGGMEGQGNDLAMLSSVDLRLVAVDPYWYEDVQNQTAMDFQDTLSADYAFGRVNGAWQRFGSGFSGGDVECVAIDYSHNRIYFGGSFTTANGITCNGIAYWDGTTFQPLGAATKGTGVAGTGVVISIAIAPNGDVWAGGDFTTAGGSATKGLAKWAYPGTGAPTVFATSTTFSGIYSIVIDKNYRIYIGGTFTAFNGTANCSYFTYSSDQGTTWTAPTATVASGGTPAVNNLALDIDGLGVYLGGDFTGIAGVSNTARIAKYSGGSFSALSTGANNNEVISMAVSPDGTLYAGGSFTTTPGAFLAKWNGTSWTNLAAAATVYALAVDTVNNLVFILASSGSNGIPYIYNGSVISKPDITLSGSPGGSAGIIVHRITGDVYIAAGQNVTATESGITTATATSTAKSYPIITITATTTAASQTTLNFIENQSSGQRLYINSLALNSGETLTIDLRPNVKKLISNWRGDLTAYVLSNSDLANFCLLPGANTIAAYMTGTITGATMLIQEIPQHLTIDGGAA